MKVYLDDDSILGTDDVNTEQKPQPDSDKS
jgi:hypothetical protein